MLFVARNVYHFWNLREESLGVSVASSDLEDLRRRPRVLFIGNSMTFYNSLDLMAEYLVADVDPAWRTALFARVAAPAYRLSQHARDLEGWVPPAGIRSVLGPKAHALHWDFVVLQDASYMMWDSPETRAASVASHVEFARLAARQGARPVLFMPWGPRDADADIFAARARATEGGLREAADSMADERILALPLPAAPAFSALRESDPALYERLFSDGSHPSMAGTYLVAALLAGVLTGKPTEPASWYPVRHLDAETAHSIRAAADAYLGEHDPAQW